MEDKFFIGVILGMVGGAVLVANSVKARGIVKDGTQEIKQKVKSLTDKKKNSSK